MKNLNYLLLLAAGATSLTAAADANWVKSEAQFLEAQRTSSIFFDVNNSDRLDIFYGGESSVAKWQNLPGIWSWQCQSNIYLNQGEGQWEELSFNIVEGEVGEDEEGNPVQYYKMEAPTHGIAPVVKGHFYAFDYNNDGNVDLFVMGQLDSNDQFGYKDMLNTIEHTTSDGGSTYHTYVALYKNLGGGKFEMVADHGLPNFRSDSTDGNAVYNNTIAAGDYDHDGYTDLFLTGLHSETQPEGYSGRVCALFRNIDGTGKFERKDIANVVGGVWTSDIKDDADNIIKAKEELPGWFLPTSNNVHMVDVNNDGWLDIVTDGWADNVWDGVHEGGNNLRIYLNRNGERFDDITPMTPAMKVVPRAGGSSLADFDGDGYLDFYITGYQDGVGYATVLATNQLGWAENENEIFEYFDDRSIFKMPDGSDCNTDWFENHRSHVRDFNGDGYLDIFLDGSSDSWMFYGNQTGTYVRAEQQLPSRGYSGNDAVCAVGDVNGNGLADQFQTGYLWEGDWKWAGYLYENKTEATVEAPAMPTGVEATINDGILSVSWNDSEADTYTAAYNIYVKYPDGKIYSVIPANPETGFLKTAYGKESAIRPMVQNYTIKADQEGTYKVGVQALSLYNETSSEFAAVEVSTSGVASVKAETALRVSVNGNFITAAADENAKVNVYNTLGQLVATGTANAPIAVEAEGVLVVTAGTQSVKIVK